MFLQSHYQARHQRAKEGVWGREIKGGCSKPKDLNNIN